MLIVLIMSTIGVTVTFVLSDNQCLMLSQERVMFSRESVMGGDYSVTSTT